MRAILLVLFVATFSMPVLANVNGVDIIVGGTEYYPGDEGKVFVELFDDNYQPIEGRQCRTYIWYPDDTLFIDGGYMEETGRGIYDYDVILPNILGVYPVSVECFLNETSGVPELISVEPYVYTSGNGALEDLTSNNNVFYKFNETLLGLTDFPLNATEYVADPGVGVDGGGPSRLWADDGDDEKWDEKGASARRSGANITYACATCNSYDIVGFKIDVQLQREIAGGDPVVDLLHYYLYNYSSGTFVEVGSHGYTVGYQDFTFEDTDYVSTFNDFTNGTHMMIRVYDSVGEPTDTKDTHNHVDLLRLTPVMRTNETLFNGSLITNGSLVFSWVNGTESIDYEAIKLEVYGKYDNNGPNGTEDTITGYMYNFNTSMWDVFGVWNIEYPTETSFVYTYSGTADQVMQYMNGTNILVKFNDTYSVLNGDTQESSLEFDLIRVSIEYGEYGIQNTVRGGNEMHVNSRGFIDQIQDIFYGVTTWIVQLLGFAESTNMGGAAKVHVFEGNHYPLEQTNLFAKLTYNGSIVAGATCYATIRNPNGSVYIDHEDMSFLTGLELYNYSLTLPDQEGIYLAEVECSNGGVLTRNVYGETSWYVSNSEQRLDEILELANQTLNLVQGLSGSVSVQPQDIVAYTAQNLTVLSALTVGTTPDDTADCKLKVYYPNATVWIDEQNMTAIGADGLYKTNVVFPEVTGNYQAISSCTGGALSGSVRGLASWEISSGVKMESIT